MKRRNFLSVTPIALGIKPLADMCDPEEFMNLIVASGTLPLGTKWAVTDMDVEKTPIKGDSKKMTGDDERKEDVKIDSPTVLDVTSAFKGYKTSYLDDGYSYEIVVSVGVPFKQSLNGIEFEFGSFGGFPWKPVFELTYDAVDEKKIGFKHPPSEGYSVYEISMSFEFEQYLGRYFVFLSEDEGKGDLKNPEDESDLVSKAQEEAETLSKAQTKAEYQ